MMKVQLSQYPRAANFLASLAVGVGCFYIQSAKAEPLSESRYVSPQIHLKKPHPHSTTSDPCNGQPICGVDTQIFTGKVSYPNCDATCGTETWYVTGLSDTVATLTFSPLTTTGKNPADFTLTIAKDAAVGTYNFTLGATCSGTAICQPYSVTLVVVIPQINLTRPSLVTVQATGIPDTSSSPVNSTFSYTVTAQTGAANVLPTTPFASGSNNTTNPNKIDIVAATNPKSSPTHGGLASIVAKYMILSQSASKAFHIPTFGMSCYYTTLASDWGTPPNQCKSLTLHNVVYSGTVKNPNGLTGTYCSSFIEDMKLQGSGQLANGTDVQYISGTFNTVTQFLGADGTPVVANQTVARDRSIIPTGGVRVDLHNVGANLLANDTGGAITQYRIDAYKGVGAAVCNGFSNIMSVGACNPGNTSCPANAIQ